MSRRTARATQSRSSAASDGYKRQEKARALSLFTARVRQGRPQETRPANAQETKATQILRLPLVEVAAKVRTGGPLDDPEDMDLPVWAGVVPMAMTFGEPVRDIAAMPAE